MGMRYPDLYGSVIACAIAGDRYDLSKSLKLTNEFFLVTGTRDTRFHGNVETLFKTLKKAKVKSEMQTRSEPGLTPNGTHFGVSEPLCASRG